MFRLTTAGERSSRWDVTATLTSGLPQARNVCRGNTHCTANPHLGYILQPPTILFSATTAYFHVQYICEVYGENDDEM